MTKCREIYIVQNKLGTEMCCKGRPMHTRSTQPCITPGSLNRVPASAEVRAGMSPLPGGR